MGKQYKGAAISREVLFGDNEEEEDEEEDDPLAPVDDDEEDDPFAIPRAVSSSSEDDEDDYSESDGSESGVWLRSRTRTTSEDALDGEMSDGSDASGISGTDSEASSALEHGQTRELDDGNSSEEESENSEADTSHIARPTLLKSSMRTKPLSDRGKLQRLILDEVDVTSSLSTAAVADAKKGKAVKQQSRAFDRLLDARIRLQKGLSAVEGLEAVSDQEDVDEDVIERAEQAALNLWSTIESLRLHVSHASANGETSSKRRKVSPPPPMTSTPLSDLWTRHEALEKSSIPHRRSVINKWSAKSRSGTSLTTTKAKGKHEKDDLVTSPVTELDNYLTSPAFTTLLSESTSSHTYTDTPFYQSLLRDLIAQRTQLSSSNTHHSVSSSNPYFPPTPIPSQPIKQKKQVDTRASKGRKVRYTVHEKVVNYEASESRETKTDSARAEFFGSLFGGRSVGGRTVRMNGVNGTGGGNDTDDDDGDEVQALRLFSGPR